MHPGSNWTKPHSWFGGREHRIPGRLTNCGLVWPCKDSVKAHKYFPSATFFLGVDLGGNGITTRSTTRCSQPFDPPW